MIIDLRQVENVKEMNGKIAIIGAGAAGITLALELSQKFSEVLLFESGSLDFEQQTQVLYDGPNLGHGGPDLISSRLRYFGGSTNHWAGQCAPLDAVDFEANADPTYSGWPITLKDLAPYYARAYPYCELGTYKEHSQFFENAASHTQSVVGGPEFELAEFRYSPPTKFGERYRAALASSDRIKVYLNANLTDLSVFDNGLRVSALEVQTLTGRKMRVTADCYVLACGGIENARILLNCNKFYKNGLGNENDLVGRFFMDHLDAGGGYIFPSDEHFTLGDFSFLAGHDEKTKISLAFANSAETVMKRQRLPCSLFLQPEFAESSAVVRAMSSPAFLAVRELVKNVGAAHFSRRTVELGCGALDDPKQVAMALYYRATDSFRNRGMLKSIFVRLEGGQMPNPESRVVLTDKVDVLGMRRVGLDWRVTDAEHQSLHNTAMEFARGVGLAGLGRMRVHTMDEIQPSTAYHHMGTTRMSRNSKSGVVDENCCVHGIANVFVAGSSIFPISGRVNPTLTIVALAIRLSDFLVTTVK